MHRTAYHLQGGQPCRLGSCRTPTMEATNAPTQRGPHPTKEVTAATCCTTSRMPKSSLHATAVPLSRTLPDPSFHDPDLTTPATDLLPEPTRTPPVTGCPQSFPRRGGALGERGMTRLHTHATWRLGDGEARKVFGGWLGFCLSHPRRTRGPH
jgi:hypothetical protein